MKKIVIISLLLCVGFVVIFFSQRDLPSNDLQKNIDDVKDTQKTTVDVKDTQKNLDKVKDLQKKIDEISASGGGIVEVPAGTFVFEEPLVLKSNVHLLGSGIDKTIFEIKPRKNGKTNERKILISNQTRNIKISNITFDGKKGLRVDKINSPEAHSIALSNVDNFEVNSIKIVDSASASIVLYNSKNGIIKNNKINNSGSNGILGLQTIENVNILDNSIDNTENQNGIFIMYQDGKSSSNILIEGNTIKNAADYAIEVGHTTQKPEDTPHRFMTVRNNVIEGAYCTGIGFRSVSNSLIENNKITGYSEANGYGCNGIFIEGRVSINKDVKVKNNEIHQINPKVIDKYPYQQAIYITGMDSLMITGNHIEKSWSDAIFVVASYFDNATPDFPKGRRSYKNIKINNNIIMKSEYAGIHFDDYPSSGNLAKNNVILYSGRSKIQVDGDPNRVEILD